MSRESLPFAGAAVAFVFLAIGIYPAFPTAGLLLACSSGLLFAIAIYIIVREWRRKSDPYSLAKLRDLDQHGETPKFEEDITEFDGVFCPHCSTVYSPKFPVCPRCRRPPMGCG